ncbi:hypothetical protein FACS1894211_08400 [Clostridia bacterium]|nr:hypothetical protein FACS1894211_08400 [Clostridia bacterium]
MSFAKYDNKIYFMNALRGNILNIYDLNTGKLSENSTIRIGHHMAGYTFNSICVANNKIFFVSDTSVFSADLNGENIIKLYESEYAWASLSQLEYKNSMLYFSETVTVDTYEVKAKFIEFNLQYLTTRILFEGTNTFGSGYEQWALPCPFTYFISEDKIYVAFGKVYSLDMQSLNHEIFYENDGDIFSVRTVDNNLFFVSMDSQGAKIYNKYNTVTQELFYSPAKGAGEDNYPYNYKKSGILFLNDKEETIYTDTSKTGYDTHFIAVESVFDESTIWKEFWNETNYSVTRRLLDGFAFDGALAFLDENLGIFLYYEGGLISIYEPDYVRFRYSPQNIYDLKKYLERDIYLFSNSLLNELILESFYRLYVEANRAKLSGYIGVIGYYNYRTSGTVYRCEVAYRVNIGVAKKDVFKESISSDTEVISKLNHNGNKYLITLFYNTPDKSFYTYSIYFYTDNCFYSISIHAPIGETLSKADLKKMAKAISVLE